MPIKKKLLSDDDYRERYFRTNVTIIDYSQSSGLSVRSITDANELESALDPAQWRDERGSMRFIIALDLSSTVIETLGSRYDVDPRLFRSHLNDYQWFHIRDPWYDAPPFMSETSQLPFFFVRYSRLYYMSDKNSVEQLDADIGRFNVLRSVQIDRMGSWTEPEDSSVGSVRTTMAFWERPPQPGAGSLGES